MNRRAAVVLAATLGVAGCGLFGRRPPPPPPAPAHYTLGGGYELNGAWYYPREQTEYEASGLAAVIPDHGGLTADGEGYDATALTASHHTLQLPVIARVTNLENGRQILVRINDRGPDSAGRLIGLSRHAAALLGVSDGTQVRVALEPDMTQALTDQIGGGPKLAIAVAPRADVTAQALPPPPGVGQSSRGQRFRGDATAVTAAPVSATRVPDRLPDQVIQTAPAPGQIYLRASEFARATYANRQAAMLRGIGARVERQRAGRSEQFRVVAGPFPTVASADAALDQARRAGVSDSHLVVE